MQQPQEEAMRLSPTSLLLLRAEQPLLFTSRANATVAGTGSDTRATLSTRRHTTVAAMTKRDAIRQKSSTASMTAKDDTALPPPNEPPRLVHTQSAPSHLDECAHTVAATFADDTRVGLVSDASPLEDEKTETQEDGDASADEEGDDSMSVSSASVDVRSTMFPPVGSTAIASRSESMSAILNPFAKDNNLRIFFPNDDLAMKAILSPPHLRASSSTGKLEAGSTTTTVVATRDSKETTNIFEQGAKLLLRGVTASVNTVAGGGGGGNGNGSSGSTHKASSGSIVEEDLDRLNNNVLVSHPALPPPPFANMFACDNCREDIGTLLSKGRHHCRNCGGSFCSDCSSKTIVVPFQLYLTRGEQRVCDGCYHRIKDFQSQAQSTNVTWSGHQPPENDVVRQEFELDENEEPVTIFNCSLFMDFTPFYGHLFLTREHLCFKGYKGHKIKIPFAKIVSLIKPQFYYINALQVKTRRKEKYFFAEFNGLRDLCFLRMDQLIRAYQEGKKQFVVQVNADDLVQHATVRRKSYKKHGDDQDQQQCEVADSDTEVPPKSTSLLSPPNRDDLDNFLSGKSTVGYIDMDRESDMDDNDSNLDSSCRSRVLEDEEDQCLEDKKSCAVDEEPFEPLPPDVPLTKTTVLLDCELRTDVKNAFELLWNDGIGQSFLYGTMEKARDIDICVAEWRPIDPGAPASETEAINKGFVISKESDYVLHRTVTSQHPPKITFPGLPPYATCNRVQRFRVNRSTSANGERWDRFIISDIHRMTKIPFSDYFEIETRWVFSRDGKHHCRVQAGLIVNFLKSTWFKSQINSSTMSESKEVLDSWAKQATEHLRIHTHTATSAPPSRRSMSASLSNVATTIDTTNGAAGNVGSNESKSRSPSVKGDSPSARRRSTDDVSFPAATPSAPCSGTSSLWTALSSLNFQQVLDAGSSPYLQWGVVLVLLYCWLLIRIQQRQIEQLTATTETLLLQLQQQSGAIVASAGDDAIIAPSPSVSATGAIPDLCQQQIVEGAAAALRQFFENAQRTQ